MDDFNLTYYIDEAGFTGEDLLSLEQPIFVQSTNNFTSNEADSIVREIFHGVDVKELKRRLDSGYPIEFFDVRTPEERASASIPGSILLTEEEAERIASLPKNTALVFHCHHGGRSQSAAERFAALGFLEVYNVEGGIDAWSQRIDPDVPRY